ncbi:hypothetical protein ACI2L4_09995 [Streptomyces sparsogenes]|uniref:hypothetical protein n=1 Tax=Streptomyces sparsogenes TaxID=67365 RepID=UPI00384C6BBF
MPRFTTTWQIHITAHTHDEAARIAHSAADRLNRIPSVDIAQAELTREHQDNAPNAGQALLAALTVRGISASICDLLDGSSEVVIPQPGGATIVVSNLDDDATYPQHDHTGWKAWLCPDNATDAMKEIYWGGDGSGLDVPCVTDSEACAAAIAAWMTGDRCGEVQFFPIVVQDEQPHGNAVFDPSQIVVARPATVRLGDLIVGAAFPRWEKDRALSKAHFYPEYIADPTPLCVTDPDEECELCYPGTSPGAQPRVKVGDDGLCCCYAPSDFLLVVPRPQDLIGAPLYIAGDGEPIDSVADSKADAQYIADWPNERD